MNAEQQERRFEGIFAVLGNRLPEAGLVIAMQTGVAAVLEYITPTPGSENTVSQMSPAALFIASAVLTSMIIIWQFLYLGFLSTACTKGSQQFMPAQLAGEGRRFFWRFIRFGFLFLFAFFFVQSLCAMAVSAITEQRPEQLELQHIALCSAVSLAILGKPMMLMPAIMIAEDEMVLPAFGKLKYFGFWNGGSLRFWFLAFMAFTAAASVSMNLPGSPVRTGSGGAALAVSVIHSAVNSAAYLLLSLKAITAVTGGLGIEKDAEQIEEQTSAE